ncbi:Os10g0531300 [Oryza sativa Japonica Group]|uniref:Os10g0531300 protein n=2 Tax=Oryza sativa subsp. japonica TaxID=39947 RepID=Q0IW58_ORYSJ|nr:Os10g0531300 [Oryza sativa Japonica Group]BAT11784.1 Os10g0531300 [Oryza sativa Japonica Group]|eukprot:NP_001065143.1 Os10g0531300 [Oryza sativa Japonica Group]
MSLVSQSDFFGGAQGECRLPELEHLVGVIRQDAPGRIGGAEEILPRGQRRRPRRVDHPAPDQLLDRREPPEVAAEHDVDEPDAVAAEEGLPPGALPERALQRLQRRVGLRHRRRPLLLRLAPEQDPQPRQPHLVVDVCRPEPRHGALVGVGGQHGGGAVGPGLVDVLQDDLRLVDGAAGVEEDGDGLVDRVGGEEEVALVAQVLLHELVRQ